jgi:uncharacterized BrkB/YihY/UPF0761 family membrane protein
MSTSNRRTLLLSGAAVIAGMSVGGASSCSTTPETILPAVIDAIQKAVATGCSYVPAVETLIALLSMFPGLSGVATIAEPLLTEVSNFLCAQFQAAGGVPAAVAAKTLSATLKGGTTVPLHGLTWDPPTGKFVSF